MRRKKKEKINIKIVIPILCVLAVIVTFVLLFDMQKKTNSAEASNENSVNTENIVNNTNTNTNVANVVDENTVDDNAVTNETVENEVDDTTVANVTQTEVTSGSDDKYSGNKQQKAIDLVKKHWGADDTIYLTNENAKSDEEYIVAVRDKATTEVKNYFKVNIKTGKVEVDY